MLTPTRLLIGVAALRAVTRQFGVGTIAMDLPVCPQIFYWPRVAAMTLCLEGGLNADETSRLFNCSPKMVATVSEANAFRLKIDPHWRRAMSDALDNFNELLAAYAETVSFPEPEKAETEEEGKGRLKRLESLASFST